METALIVSIHYGILDLLRYLVDTQRVTLTGELLTQGVYALPGLQYLVCRSFIHYLLVCIRSKGYCNCSFCLLVTVFPRIECARRLERALE